jgi:type II secretory pathway component PulK
LQYAMKHKFANNRKGLVLIAVLWVAVVLIVIVVSAGRNSQLDTKVRFANTDQMHCKWASRAGVEKAVAILNTDQSKGSDSLTDSWNDNDEELSNIKLGQCRVSVDVIDEASKLNVNTATKKQLLGLENMTEEIADAIIDWRDENDTPSQAGAEGGYYENLRHRYKIRNGPLRTIRELLLVKDVTPELLYGEDHNFNGKLDYNERDGQASLPLDNGDDKLDKGWIAYLTCYSVDNNKDAQGNDRIDINEADEAKLEQSLNIKKSDAKWIVENRSKDKEKYKSIADLINDKSPKKSSDKESENAEPLSLETFSKIADKLTITKDKQIVGRVNINTAPKIVLACLLGGDDDAKKLADEIITYRQGLTDGMDSIADLLQVSSMKIETFKEIANHITTRSDIFMIRSIASVENNAAGGATSQTEALINRNMNPYQTFYWYQGVNN